MEYLCTREGVWCRFVEGLPAGSLRAVFELRTRKQNEREAGRRGTEWCGWD